MYSQYDTFNACLNRPETVELWYTRSEVSLPSISDLIIVPVNIINFLLYTDMLRT